MNKKIYVEVTPPCISVNRELGYIEEARRQFLEGRLNDDIVVDHETEDAVYLIYRR